MGRSVETQLGKGYGVGMIMVVYDIIQYKTNLD